MYTPILEYPLPPSAKPMIMLPPSQCKPSLLPIVQPYVAYHELPGGGWQGMQAVDSIPVKFRALQAQLRFFKYLCTFSILSTANKDWRR